ncbi:MAG TPA: hypothetical protein VER33_02500 [Polyangiaceae bacterium]|nr:hypothetical protein [Polyangiaceae bacterium]
MGEHILARHATPDDRKTLQEAGSAALTSKDVYRVCSVVDALATIGAAESLPLLAEVYSSVPYSLARTGVVSALFTACLVIRPTSAQAATARTRADSTARTREGDSEPATMTIEDMRERGDAIPDPAGIASALRFCLGAD